MFAFSNYDENDISAIESASWFTVKVSGQNLSVYRHARQIICPTVKPIFLPFCSNLQLTDN